MHPDMDSMGTHSIMANLRAKKAESTEEAYRYPPVERCTVQRRGSLLPKAKPFLRILNQLEDETHPLEHELKHEHELTSHLRQERDKEYKMDMDPGSTDVSMKGTPPATPPSHTFYYPASSSSSPNTPVSMLTRSRMTMEQIAPSVDKYQCSKLNPEVEMNFFQDLAPPSPTAPLPAIGWSGKTKRKISDDRFDPYFAPTFKRRAVSPSVNHSPILGPIFNPNLPTLISMTTSTSYSANAAARARSGSRGAESLVNIQDASGGFSKMSLE